MRQVSKKTLYKKPLTRRLFKHKKYHKALYRSAFYEKRRWVKKLYWKQKAVPQRKKLYILNAFFKKDRQYKQRELSVLRTLWPQHRQSNVVKLLDGFKKAAKQKKQLNFNVKRQERTLLKPLATWNKTKVTTYDKLFYYYTVKTPMSLYAHKCFILLEMQLNASLVRMKLVPYLFLVNELCFYRIVRLNGASVSSPYHILSLYDNVSIPVSLYNYMYYRNYRIQHYPRQLAKFFKRYWMQFTNYNQNKVWLLSNFLVSNVTAEAIIFDYPNIISYMLPFRRFTNLYYRNQTYTEANETSVDLAYTHTIIKLKLFTYASFYKS